jgi:hypothetical protein
MHLRQPHKPVSSRHSRYSRLALLFLTTPNLSCKAAAGVKASPYDAGAGFEPAAGKQAEPDLSDASARDAATPRSVASEPDDAGVEPPHMTMQQQGDGSRDASQEQPIAPRVDSELIPWGIASSASTSRSIADWAQTIARSGAHWVRGFDTSMLDATLQVLDDNNLEASGVLLWSPTPETTLPVDDLTGWNHYVRDVLGRSHGRVKAWEIWNEPPNFTSDTAPASYASVVRSAHQAARALGVTCKLGIGVQSVNLNYLARALDAGACDHFDYVTLHPYETVGLIRHSGWEAQYMSIVPTVRKLLADKCPQKREVPIYFTELGEPLSLVTPVQQAAQLVKAYVMGLAQGVARIHWFEVTDGDSGTFGLVDGTGVIRPAFTALSSLVERLGAVPRYEGYALLSDQAHGFVFTSAQGPVAIAWTPPDTTLDLTFESEVDVQVLGTTKITRGTQLTLTNTPVLLSGIPPSLVHAAKASAGKPFPWNGDFSHSSAVRYDAGSGAAGLHPLDASNTVTVDGVPARVVPVSYNRFAVDPNFNAYTPVRLRIEAVVRRNGAAAARFTLRYESIDGLKAVTDTFQIPGSDQWYTATWEVSDTQFVGKWGYHIDLDSETMANADYSLRSLTVTKL